MLNSRSSVARWLWTNNPFYAISALLMLYAVRASYGELEIGAINCWLMMGGLAGYTSVLAAVGIVIVRWGHVWDDARSIFLILLIMFLAVSVSADDLFVKMESSTGALTLLGCGLAFAVVVFQCVLLGAKIRLGAAYQIPFFLFLALFYATPWWCSPELHPTSADSLNWSVFLFPQVAALICLSLLPAVRAGRDSVANSGTPWPWPMFPWVAFGVIGSAVVLRSYALSLTFSQTGPIWISASSRQGIVLDTIWRPYFVVPFLLAVMLLVLEAGLKAGNRQLVRRIMQATPVPLLIALPWGNGAAANDFYLQVTNSIGSPLWLTTLMLLSFCGWAVLRGVPNAGFGVLALTLLLSCVGPQTINVNTLAWQPGPMFATGAILAMIGLMRHSSSITSIAAVVMTLGLWLALPQSLLVSYRATICYHALMFACLLISLTFSDLFAKLLRAVGAAWIPLSALMVVTLPTAMEIALQWRLLYIGGLAGVSLVCAQMSRGQSYWVGFVGTTTVLGYTVAVTGFRQAGAVVGRNAMTAFSWSIGTFVIGALISAYKARWLPPLTVPAWIGGGPDPEPEHKFVAESVIAADNLESKRRFLAGSFFEAPGTPDQEEDQ